MNAAEIELIDELEYVREDCLQLLERLWMFCPPSPEGDYPDTLRLIAVPFLYAVWERCFTLSHAIAVRFLRERFRNPQGCNESLKALWLQREPFFQSFTDTIRQAGPVSERAVNRTGTGRFRELTEFLAKLSKWEREEFSLVDSGSYVMTHSNVNPEVVALNATAIGLDQFVEFQELNFGRLHDLVARRNDIGHGTMKNVPGNREFMELFEFTQRIVDEYPRVFSRWLHSI